MKYYILNITIPLTIGTAIYLLFRNLTYFSFADLSSPLLNSHLIPNWILFQLPDALWAYAFCSCIIAIWKKSSLLTGWLLAAFIAALTLEFAQLAFIVPGTFDWLDIGAYSVGFIVAFLVSRKNFNIIFNTQKSIPL